jgi:hypothetical protein
MRYSVSCVSSPHGSVFFPDTQIAVMRQGGMQLVFACKSRLGDSAHAHAEDWDSNSGMAPPLLIESGCCNYDDPALVSWYRTTRLITCNNRRID